MGARTRVKPTNTMVVPGIDVVEEVALINQGRGRNVGNGRFEINGRVYVVKPDGGASPESGPGVTSVSRPVMLALRKLIAHDGLTPGFIRATEQFPT